MLKTVGFPSTRTGDQTIVDGNLVIGTSGKGIDFSATAGTGTSELLADYEEGTWTPNQGSGLTVIGAFTSSGTYTRVGRQVTVTGRINAVTSIVIAAGGVICTNLPISASLTPYSAGTMINATQSAGGQTVAADGVLYGTSMAATTTVYFTTTYFV